MWPFKVSSPDLPHQQADSAPPPENRSSERWRLVALISLALFLLLALLGGWAYLTFWAGAAYEGVVWQRQDNDSIITVEFRRIFIVGNREVTFQRRLATLPEGEGPSARHSATYTVLDAKTLELSTAPGTPPEKLTIDSITREKLVLSGGPWKLDKTEFTRQK